MNELPIQLQQLTQAHPVRLKRAQKDAFLEDAKRLLEEWGYAPTISEDTYLAHNRNLVVGDTTSAKLLFTAHYDTPYRMLLGSNTIFPKNLLLTILVQLPILLVVIGAQLLGLAGAALLGAPLWAAQIAGLAALLLVFWLLMFCAPNPSNRNDNTSGVAAVLCIAQALPEALRGRVAFVLFDNEEKGMLGSMGFRKAYGARMRGTLVNFDCVGEGDSILLLQSAAALKDTALVAALEAARPQSSKALSARSAKGYMYPSDHMLFQKHIAAAAFREKKPFGLYIGKLHTAKDTELDTENIRLLCEWMRGLVEAYGA